MPLILEDLTHSMPLILEKAVSLQLIINTLQIMKKYLKRHIDQELEIWAESQERKPCLYVEQDK